MGHYTHLSMRERCLINTFLAMNLEVDDMAERMKRHRSTIYREIGRNAYCGYYMPAIAHEKAQQRHNKPSNKIDENLELNKFVMDGLLQGWTPEQISGRMKNENLDFYVCPESIYRYIYRHKDIGLYKLLPSRKAKRRSRSNRKQHEKMPQIYKRNIKYRSEEVSKRNKIGHWEGDTIRFQKDKKSCVTTLVERKSRFVCLRKNENGKSKNVIENICKLINSIPKKMWDSLTLDQGSEFMDFRTIERQTKSKIYFCDPRSPWQRGSNENMNGRLRRYLPNEIDIDKIDQEELDRIALQANNTPRKCLGFLTPNEVILQHWKGFCRTPL